MSIPSHLPWQFSTSPHQCNLYCLMVLLVIILPYQLINGNLYRYTGQGLNCRMKLRRKIMASLLRKWFAPFKFQVPLSRALCFSFESFVLLVEGSRAHNGSLLEKSSGSSATRLHRTRSRRPYSFFAGGGCGTRRRLSCGQSVNFREGRPIKFWDFFAYFYQEIIPWTGSEISQSDIINGSRCSDLGDQKYFLQIRILFSCITGLCLWEVYFFFHII